MKHFVLECIFITLFIASCSCSGQTTTEPVPHGNGEDTSYVPQPEENPFPEYEPPEIDTSSFTQENIPVNFTTVNDFHGQIDEEADDKRVGLAKMAKYLRNRKSKGDVLISNGDMYQGSYLCSVDKGQFVSYSFKYLGFDAYVLGNHEFDWDLHPLLDNQAAIGENFLCANLYSYPKKNVAWQKANLGEKYKIINLYEGTPFEVKIGIIGVIGKSQISSINSQYTTDYIFLDPTDIVKDIAVDLRDNKKCDFVIASYHDAEPDESIASTAKNKSYKYVDACFMAHTHKYEHRVINGVPFVQASAYSRGVSTINFSFNKKKHTNELTYSGYTYLADKGLLPDSIVDQKINEKKSKYRSEYETIIGTNEVEDLDYGKMSQFYAKISFDQAVTTNKEHPIVGCMFNESRRGLKTGEFTYSDLFETHPFLNGLYIMSVTEQDINNEKKYSYGYINPEARIGNSTSRRWDILVFDYNGFHIGIDKDYNKYYNYFPSAFAKNAPYEPIKLDFTCLDVALKYLEIYGTITDSFFETEGLYYRTA